MIKVFRGVQVVWLSVAILFFTVLVSSSVSALSPYISGTTGTDVSWPNQNCRAVEDTPSKSSFGIIGVNHGLDFTTNECLVNEASLLSDDSLYLNTGYPGASYGLKYQSFPDSCSKHDNKCLSYNYGFNAAKYSIDFAALNNIHATHWWLDVESDNSWTTSPAINVSNLRGMVAAIKKYSLFSSVGIYSFPGQWYQLTGDWQSGLPAWIATGTYNRSSAITTCQEPSFTGGKVVLTQYTLKLDQDYAC